MDVLCTADLCPVILNSTCVFYEGNTLTYTGITTNDSLQTALQKIDAKFGDAMVGYTFTNGVFQSAAGAPVGLGGNLTTDITIGGNFTLTFAGNVKAAKHVTTGGTASQFVKGDGTLDSTAYQAAGNYITALTGDVIAAGPGSVAASLAVVNSNPGTYGSGTRIPVVTVDTKGRVTALTTTAINVPSGSLSFVGDVYGSGVTGSQTTLTLNNVNTNVYTNNTFLKFKVNAKGLVTGASPVTNVDIEGVLGYVPTPETRTITINGVTKDLQTNVIFSLPGGGTVQSVSVTAGTGIAASVDDPTITPNITITNTAPDQVVTITGQSGIDVTGTYPNFTISANEEGAVTSVTASAPLASSGGQTPNITITQAGASTDGYLTSTDWNTFNNKVPTTRTLSINGTSYDLSADRSWTINSMVYPGAGIALSTGTGWDTSIVDNSANWNTAYSLRLTSATAPLNITGTTISIAQAGTSANGFLSSTDWNTFNNKQASGNYITSLTGEATASGPGAAAVTLSTPAVTSKLLTGVNITGGTVVDTDTILQGFGKLQNQINGLIGGSIYQGVWNASTNTPTLTSGVGTDGYYYIVNVAGTTNLDGITDWHVGDWAIFHGGVWQQVDNTDAVVSVNGYTGAVSLVSSDIPEGLTNLYYTDTRARAAISLTTTGTSGAATYDNITGVLNVPNYTTDVSGYVPYTGATTNVDLGVYEIKATTLSVNTTPPVSTNVGDIVWNPIDGTFDMNLLNGVTLQAGQELHFYGKAVGAIGDGQAVMFAGVQGDHLLMTLADPTTINANPEYFIGVATQNFANNDFGYITVFGSVRGLNTLAYTLGEVLYFDSTAASPGLLTGTKPVAPNAKIEVCAVVRVHGTQGILKVRPHVMPRLSDIQDVYAPTIVTNDILAWSTNRWEAKTIADVLGYTPANGANYVPYTGATGPVNLGPYNLTVSAMTVGNNGDEESVIVGKFVTLTGLSATAVGYGTTAAVNSVAIGRTAQSAQNSVAIGYGSNIFNYGVGVGRGTVSGSYSVAIGYLAGNAPNYNISIGYNAGSAINNGSYNTLVGGYTGTSTMSNNVILSDGQGNIRFQWDGTNIRLNGNIVGSNAYTSTPFLPLAGGTMTGALVINPANSATVGLDVASNTFTLRTDSSQPFNRQLTTTLGSGTLVKMQAAGFGATYVTDLGFYTSSSSAVNTTPNLYLTGGNNYVGVNTDAPAYALDVVGDVNVTGTFRVNGIPLSGGGVTSFNTRTGAITLTSTDVTTALGYTPVTDARTLTINGTTYDLTANRSWTIAPSSSARTEQTFTATAGQTTFTVTGGYVVGLVDVYVNGVKYSPADYTATNGSTVVLNTGVVVGDIVDIINYTATIAALPTSRDVFDYTATAAQTTFTVTGGYTAGLLDVYVNGVKLTPSEVTATNGTTFVLTNPSVVGDQVQAIRYNTSISGLSGSGTANFVPKFTASGTIGNSLIYSDATSVGIGNTNPSSFSFSARQLVLGNTSSFDSGLTIAADAEFGYGSIYFANGTVGDQAYRGYFSYEFGSDDLNIGTAGVGRIRILGGGDVRIWNTAIATNFTTPVRSSGNNTYTIAYSTANAASRSWRLVTDIVSFGDFAISQSTTQTGSTYDNSRLYVSPTGNVGIGTSLPTGTYGKLTVAGGISILNDNNAKLEIGRYSSGASNSYIKLGASSNSLRITNNTDVADIFTIENGGNVGIGTTAPASILHLYNLSIGTQLRIQSDLDQAGLRLISGSGTTNRASRIDFLNGASSTTVPRWSLISDYNQNGTNDFSLVTENPSVRAVVVTQSGNVGIGTTTPTTYSLAGRHLELNDAGGGYSFIHCNTTNVKSFFATNEIAGLSALFTFSNHPLTFGANNTERMRITSTGRVGIGTTSPSGRLSVSSDQGVNNQLINIVGTQSGFAQEWGFGFPSSSRDLRIYDYTNGLERARFTSGGFLKATNSGAYLDANGNFHELRSNSGNSYSCVIQHASTSLPYGLGVFFTGASPNSTNFEFIYAEDTTQSKFIVWSNGSVVNRTGSYGTISDVKFKENIVDATPKLGDIAKLKVRNFNLKGENTKQIGFIAQEFEEVFPNMVDVSTEKGTNGETYKSIKTSVLVPMLVKAVQELKAELDLLKNK